MKHPYLPLTRNSPRFKYSSLISLFLASVLQTSATTFYVSTTGSDSNDGLSELTPFETIQKAADEALPGDTVLIRGGFYREEVSLPRSGTAGNPIVFQAFGTENVTVSATDLLTGFTQTPELTDNANVYVATLSGSTTNSLLNSHELTVFVDGQLVQGAKNRNNADYLRSSTWPGINSSTGTTVTDSELIGIGNVTGGFIRVRTNDFAITNRKITAHNTTTGTITLASSVGSVNGRDYLVHDARSLVDSAGEWYFDEENNQFYLWAPGGGDPDNYTVEVKRRAEAFDTNGYDHLHFQNLTLTGGDFDTSLNNAFSGPQSDHLLIENVHFIATDRIFSADFGTTRTALNLSGNNNIVRNCEFEKIWSVAIRLRGSDNQIVNNYFHDSCYNGGGSGGIATSGNGQRNLISHNTFTEMGRSAIVGSARRNLYQFNDFSNCALLTEDTGAVYAFNSSYENSVFRFNTFHDVTAKLSTGFYVDNFVTDVAFHNNITWNTNAFGYKANQPNSFILHYNNTAFSSGRLDVEFPSFDSQYGGRFYNNIASSLDGDLTTGSDPAKSSNNFLTSASGNFLNASTGDFRLQSSSGAVNAGRIIPGITTTNSPDAGAYELGTARYLTGHNFASPPSPVYDLTTPVFGANLMVNGSFEHGFEAFSLTGSVTSVNQIASNLRSDALTRYGKIAAVLDPDEAVTQTITNLTPNTTYTLGGWAKPIRQIIEAESLNPSSDNTNTSSVRGQTTVGPLQNNDTLIYDDVDFTGVDELTLQIAQSVTSDQVQIRLDSASGTLIDTISLPSNTNLVRSSSAIDISSVTGVHDLYLTFTGSGTLGQLESLRLSQSTDRVRLEASNFGASSISTRVGMRTFTGATPRAFFTTGPTSTSADISVTNDSEAVAYVDYLSLTVTEASEIPSITIDTSLTQFNYDLGTENSPLFNGSSSGVSYQRLTPATSGDITWTGPLTSADYNVGNDINRDFVGGTTPATFNHTVANGFYTVTVNMSNPSQDLDNMFINAEGASAASGINRPIGTNTNIIFDVTVRDGELNLEFGDADTNDPAWVVNRILLAQRPGRVVDFSQLQYNYDLGPNGGVLFTSNSNVIYEEITPTVTGEISWSRLLTAGDRGSGSGNAINRDFIAGTAPTTFRHLLANGTYELTINMSDPSTNLDNMFINAEGVTAASNIDRPTGTNTNIIFDASVNDGEINLEFGDTDTDSPAWVVNRIIFKRKPTAPPGLNPNGGTVALNTPITFINADGSGIGEIYYTTDGSDPRNGANPSATALAASSNPLTITSDIQVNARTLIGDLWSSQGTASFVLDSDGDGLPDFLEQSLYGDPTVNTDGTDDFDQDGLDDLSEWIAGTTLDDNTSALRISALNFITAPDPADNEAFIQWTSVPGRRYTVSRTFDLVNPTWTVVGSEMIATGSTSSMNVVIGTQEVFFRVNVTAP